MKLESLGKPTVTVVTDEFLTLAKAEAEVRGLENLRLIKVPHPVGSLSLDELKSLAHSTFEPVIDALTSDKDFLGPSDSGTTVEEVQSEQILRVPASPGEIFQYFSERGWTDGLPIIPPTKEAVDAMIEASGKKGDDLLGIIPPLNGQATVEKVAINAVMAGCEPKFVPVVMAALRCILLPSFNLSAVQTTTGNVTPLFIVNGPCRHSLNINYSYNVLGQGWRANATIGRAIRLILTNIGGGIPGVYDKATLGQPAKYTFCIAENEAESPWEPLHVERGFDRQINTVTAFGCSGILSIVDKASKTAEGLLTTAATAISGGGVSMCSWPSEALIIIGPQHAAIFRRDGYKKQDIRQVLFERARLPHEKFSEENLELIAKRRPRWFRAGEKREIPVVDSPEDIWIVVAGGKGTKSAFIPSFKDAKMTTATI